MNFRTLDLNLLRVYDAVMAEGNITRAAQRLSMTQPAVSNALKRLRDSLGEDLLTRTARGVRPTAFGEALWPQVRDALVHLRQAFEPDTYDPLVDDRVLRVAMPDAVATLALPALMQRLTASGAQARIEVHPLVDRDPRPLLAADEVDFAVGHFPEVAAALVAQGRLAPFRHQRLAETRYVCAMCASHPLAAGPLTLDDFCAADHALVSFSGRSRGFVDQVLESLGRARRIAITVNQFYTAAQVVLACELLTVVPAGFTARAGMAGLLVEHDLPLDPGPVYVDALWHARHENAAAHRWLVGELVAVADRISPGAGAAPENPDA